MKFFEKGGEVFSEMSILRATRTIGIGVAALVMGLTCPLGGPFSGKNRRSRDRVELPAEPCKCPPQTKQTQIPPAQIPLVTPMPAQPDAGLAPPQTLSKSPPVKRIKQLPVALPAPVKEPVQPEPEPPPPPPPVPPPVSPPVVPSPRPRHLNKTVITL